MAIPKNGDLKDRAGDIGNLAQPGETNAWRKRMFASAILFLLVVALYASSLWNDFVYDDFMLIVFQPVHSLGDVMRAFGERHWLNLPYYRPVVRATFLIQKLLHGNSPAPYHLFNVVLMGIAVLLAYALLRMPKFAIQPVPALIGAALFAVHPVTSSTVYPICSGRESLMPALFILAAVYAYLQPSRKWRVAAMVCFALALLCKEQAVIVPGLFVLADVLGLSAVRARRPAWLRRYWPVIGILLVYGFIRWRLFAGGGEHHVAVFDRPTGPLWSLAYALQTTLIPFVELVYEPPVEIWFSWWRMGISLVVLLVLAAWTWQCNATIRTPALFWLGWIGLSLLPTANLLVQEAPFAERFLFLGLVGVVGIVAALASWAWSQGTPRTWFVRIAALLLLVCAAMSFSRHTYFRDDETFNTQWVSTNPRSDVAHTGLGYIRWQQDRLDEAITHLQQALQINPDAAEANYYLGNIFREKGDPRQAELYYQQALDSKSDVAGAHCNLGLLLFERGDAQRATFHLNQAIEIDPNVREAHYALGAMRLRDGDLTGAADHLRRAIQINPQFADAHNSLAEVLERQGMLDEAADHYASAVDLDPSFARARKNLDRIRAKLGADQ